MSGFDPNESPRLAVRRVGRAREPVLVVEDALSDPAPLVEAAAAADWAEAPAGGYPGLRAALPGAYVRALVRRLDPVLRARLLPGPARLDRFECGFSLVTRAPGALAPAQRLPHVDVADPWRVAVLHYLCGPLFGGTAFFRQEATGLERVHPEDRARWAAARAAEMAALVPGGGYPGAATPGYVRTGAVEARMNRVAAYRSFVLHSGIVEAPEALSADPRRGRLTANLFLDYRPL